MPANHLKKIHTYLKKHPLKRPINYTIPDYWNYTQIPSKKVPGDQVLIQPVVFFKTLIETVYLNASKTDASKPLSSIQKTSHKPGDWLKEASIYSAMVRTTSAWDADRSGVLEDANIDGLKETGTFLKMLILLPRLKAMGINTLYLLPITEYSLKDKKGELGSPYGIKDLFELDHNLSDPLVEDEITLNEQFAALVEACHILEMRVMIDIIPRTNAVDSRFIKDYPEWFYWIKKEAYKDYFPPAVDGIPPVTQPRKKDFELMYASKNVKKHLSYFSVDPKTLDPKKWAKIKDETPLVDAVEKTFGLKIAPAFSDHINDPQPPWTDITFFRLYLDHPIEAVPYIDKNQPPYILFDTIKSNLYPGKTPNMPLWNTLADIIPYFQRTFGIDGARIDMGHALPKALLKLIIDKARENDPDFGFIAEELSPKNGKEAKENGYNLIISNGFMMQPKVFEGKTKEFFITSKDLALPVFASAETHDTPRTASREGGRILANTLTLLNYFMPNGVFFMNTGLEVYEPQPMNTGLDNSEGATKKLLEDDPYYGKLALFDRYQIHYLHPQRFDIYNMLSFLNPLKKTYQKALMDPKKTMFIPHENPFFLGYVTTLKEKPFKALMVLANLNPYGETYLTLDLKTLIPDSFKAHLVFATHEASRSFDQIQDGLCDLHLGAGEVKLVEFK
jgi:glycosidase